MDPNFLRATYVRYADDFIISVIGPYELAVKIQERIMNFLKDTLQLDLNLSKTSITPKAAYFLGTEIRVKTTAPGDRISKSGKRMKITPRLSLHAPIKILLEKLGKKSFLK
jgi:hypothetical protein